MKDKNILYGIIFIVVYSILSCNLKDTAKNNDVNFDKPKGVITITENQFKNYNMKLGSISFQNFSESIVTNGHIDVPPSNIAKVSAVMGGIVKNAPLLVGNEVKKGQVLLSIENPYFIDLQQAYLEIFEKLKYLRSEYERQQILFDEKITSERNFLKAESEFKTAKALFSGLEQKLLLLNLSPKNVLNGNLNSVIQIYAPISGSVSEVNTSVGKYMEASEVLMEIIDSSHKHIELVVFEKDVLSLEIGQEILFRIPENSKESFRAEVYLIGKSIDEKNRTVQIHGHLDEEFEQFLVGMFVEAEININVSKKRALPVEAILEEDNEFFVFVLKEKNRNGYDFTKTSVNTGEKGANFIEILNPNFELEKAQILIKGAFIPRDEVGGGHNH